MNLCPGVDDWIDIKHMMGNCIVEPCSSGLSVGFWMNFQQGDFIFAAGGYAGKSMKLPSLKICCKKGFYRK